MQLRKIGDSRPLLITAGLITTGAVSAAFFSYDDYKDAYSNINVVIQNSKTSDYIEKVASESYNKFLFETLFHNHFEQWKMRTQFSSSAKAIVEDENFQAIISMRENAVPFIIQKIKEGPTLLVWALNFIYGKKISSNSNISIKDAGKLWLKELQA
jgi:hypothetical protein